jgi:hypothetical protein
VRNAVKLSEPIVCPDCRASDAIERPRTLGGVVVFNDGTYLAWHAEPRRSRHRHGHTLARGIFPTHGERDSYVRERYTLEPGERAEVPCGRKHYQPDGTSRPTIVVIDDDAVAAALRRAGVDVERLRRLSAAEAGRLAWGESA